MRHRKAGRKLSRNSSHRLAMFNNLLMALFSHERIQTTDAKAKELRPIAEKMITLGKRGTLHARRLAARHIHQADILQKLFNEIGPRFQTRPGGYCRIYKVGVRQGDGAPMSLLELLGADEVYSPKGERVEAVPAEVTSKERFDGVGGEAAATTPVA